MLFPASLVAERIQLNHAWLEVALADARGVLAVLGCVAAAVLLTSTRIGARLANHLGRRTLAVYVLHVLVIEAMISGAAVVPVDLVPAAWPWLAPPVITGAIVGICLAGERLLLATPLRVLLRTPSRLIAITAGGRRSTDSVERPRDPFGTATF